MAGLWYSRCGEAARSFVPQSACLTSNQPSSHRSLARLELGIGVPGHAFAGGALASVSSASSGEGRLRAPGASSGSDAPPAPDLADTVGGWAGAISLTPSTM